MQNFNISSGYADPSYLTDALDAASMAPSIGSITEKIFGTSSSLPSNIFNNFGSIFENADVKSTKTLSISK